jgi:hypothetical protein
VTDLVVSLMMGGTDLNGGQDVNGYELEATTRGEMAVSLRKQQVENPYTEGTYTVNSVRQNVTETVAVWVYAPDHSTLERRLQVIKDYVIQPAWTLVWGLPGLTETWNCQSSEYTISSGREFKVATMALIKLAVDRLPTLTRTYSDATVWTG